jgi:uncharacterized membrane protein YgcG
MILRPRIAILALVATFGMAFVTGCGGGSSGHEASSSTDVNQLLQETFSGGKSINSGRLDLGLRVDAKGSSASGPISISLAGPFQSQGKGKLPKLDLEAKVEGAGQNIDAGVVSTGDKGFVKFQGQSYAVSDAVFQQFKKGFEQAQSQAGKQKGQSLATLGIDPRRWLSNPKNEGDAKVGDTDTIKITGDVNVPKLLDDINSALAKAKSLGVQGSANIPSQLTDAQKKQAADAIKHLSVEIYTGKSDQILRRMLINLSAVSQGQTADVSFDLQLLDVNQDQTINEPSGAKPFDQLLSQLGGLSGLAGGSSSSGSGSSSSGSGSSSGGGAASSDNLQKYSACIEKAGSDAAKARKCANLLTSP